MNRAPIILNGGIYGAPAVPGGSLAYHALPVLMRENWNYTSGQLFGNASLWSTSNANWYVQNGSYINYPTWGAAGTNAANLSPSISYDPTLPHGMDISLSSSNASIVQIVFEQALASTWFIKFDAFSGGCDLIMGGGGTGADAQIDDSAIPHPANNSTLWTIDLKIRVSALSAGSRFALVKASLENQSYVNSYSRNITAPTAGTGQNFNFENTITFAGSGVDQARVSAFTFYGFKK